MIRSLVIIVFLVSSFFVTAQNSSKQFTVKETAKAIEITISPVDLNSNIAYYSNFVVRLNYKKSRELISIKAFRKTTHIRAKKTNRC